MKIMPLVLLPLLVGCGGGFKGTIVLPAEEDTVELIMEQCVSQARKVDGGWNLIVRDEACKKYDYIISDWIGEAYAPEWQEGQVVYVSDLHFNIILEEFLKDQGLSK